MKRHEHAGCSRRSLGNPAAVLLAAGLKAGETLLDVGTGTGYLALAAASIVGPGGRVYAMDVHEESVGGLRREIADRGIGNVETLTADATAGIPLPGGSVDVCLLSNVLHGFAANEESAGVLKALAGVLREGGRVVVLDFRKQETPYGPPVDIRLSPDEVEALFARYGFSRERLFDAGPHHYGIVLRRGE